MEEQAPGIIRKILIVEDDAFLSDMYQTKFLSAGYEVLIALDGEQCLEKLKNGFRPDVILLDIVMPRLDGIETLSAIKKNEATKNIPVILLSNLRQENDIKRGMEMGAVEYLIKAHYTPSEVEKKVEEIMKNSL